MSEPGTDGSARQAQSPAPMRFGSIAVITVYFVVMTAILLHGLVILWPPDEKADERAIEALRGEAAEPPSVPAEVAPADVEALPGEPPASPADTSAAGEAPVEAAEEGTAVAAVETGTPASVTGASPPVTPDDSVEHCRPCNEELEDRVTFFGIDCPFCLYPEERLFLIVLFAGALGGLLHALRSFYWYLGNRKLVVSWTGFYITLPFAGALMAFVFYLVIRGGFTQSGSGLGETNPFGFAALAVLVGLFTDQAAQRLRDVAETAFARVKPGTDHVAGPTIERIAPVPGSGGKRVEITGTGFADDDVVLFAGRKAATVERTATRIVIAVPEGTATGEVAVEVVRPGGERASRTFAYQPPASS